MSEAAPEVAVAVFGGMVAEVVAARVRVVAARVATAEAPPVGWAAARGAAVAEVGEALKGGEAPVAAGAKEALQEAEPLVAARWAAVGTEAVV